MSLPIGLLFPNGQEQKDRGILGGLIEFIAQRPRLRLTLLLQEKHRRPHRRDVLDGRGSLKGGDIGHVVGSFYKCGIPLVRTQNPSISICCCACGQWVTIEGDEVVWLAIFMRKDGADVECTD